MQYHIYIYIYVCICIYIYICNHENNVPSATYPGCLRNRCTGLGAQTLAPKKHFLSFSFISCISTKVAIAMHLISSKWLRRQKSRREKMRQKFVEVKEEIADKSVFIHLNTK